MRDTLHAMELVDRYLDGTMPPSDRTPFELRADDNPELRQLIEDQRALREGMHRIALRKIAATCRPSGGNGWFGTMTTSVVLVVAGACAWLYWPPSERHEQDQPVVKEERMIEKPSADAVPAEADSSAPAVPERTPPIVRTDTHVVVKPIRATAAVTDQHRATSKRRASNNSTGSEETDEPSPLNIQLQNVLTPDGDRHNDRLIIPGGPFKWARMEVRDATHRIVFEQEGTDPIWYGTLAFGQPASDGIYYCNVEATDQAGKTYRGYGPFRLVRGKGGAVHLIE